MFNLNVLIEVSIECFICGSFFKKTIGSFFSKRGRFFMDVISISSCNPKKRLVHKHIKAGLKSKIIIIKWKWGSYLEPNSRTQLSPDGRYIELLTEGQHTTSYNEGVMDGGRI